MICNGLLEDMKSHIWLCSMPFDVPLLFFNQPPFACVERKPITIDYLDDIFELYVIKLTDSIIQTSFKRIRQQPQEPRDNGCILAFYFIMVGFDEETKVALMTHDLNHASVTFTLSDSTLSKLESPTSIFDLFVVVQMLEIRSLEASDSRKMLVDQFVSFMKSQLLPEGIEQLGVLLKRPGLDDVFTGRTPLEHVQGVISTVVPMIKYYEEITEYINAKSINIDAPLPNFDVSKHLNFVAYGVEDIPITHEHAVEQYIIAHKLGLDFYKTLTSDYLLTILDKDYMVLNILEAAILLHDEDMFETAVIYFLNNFHEVTRSAKFHDYAIFKGHVARLIIHATYMWVLNNDVYIPGWQPTTEL